MLRVSRFAESEAMVCSPDAIEVQEWMVPGVDADDRVLEAMARILRFSQIAGEWVGVDLRVIVHLIDCELQIPRRIVEVRERNNLLQGFYRQDIFWWWTLSFVTFGYARLHMSEPVMSPMIEYFPSLPASGIYRFGPKFVLDGLNKLVRSGHLMERQHGYNGDASIVYHPTRKLVENVAECQNIV